MAAETLDSEAIRKAIDTWTAIDQVALAQAILQHATATLAATTIRPTAPQVPSAALRGILANGQPAPSDEEVALVRRGADGQVWRLTRDVSYAYSWTQTSSWTGYYTDDRGLPRRNRSGMHETGALSSAVYRRQF